MGEVEILQQANASLGEGPVWDRRLGVLYWGDLKQNRIYRFDPSKNQQTGVWPLPYSFGCHALTSDPNILAVVTDRGYELLNLVTGDLTSLANPEAGLNINCWNDGKVGPDGRFWVGSLPLAGSRGEEIIDPSGKLYSLALGGESTTHAEGIFNTNGLCWDVERSRFYHIDSWLYTVFVYDYNPVSGAISNKTPFIQFEREEGGPDGMTIDRDGNLWIAMWDGWCIQSVSPQGERVRKIELPVQKPTSCIFGGPQLDEMYIATASCYLDAPALERGPSAGALLRVKLDVSGVNEYQFSLGR